MEALRYLLVFSMLCVALSFDMLDDEGMERDLVEMSEVLATARLLYVYSGPETYRGSRQIRAATKKPKSKTKGGGSSKGKRPKLNKINQKFWRELLDCCTPPDLLNVASLSSCYPKYKTFKGQATVGPPRLPKAEPFNRTCLVECAFRKESLIDKTTGLLSITGIDRKIKGLMISNPKWFKSIQLSYDDCNSQYTSLINPDLTCHSGAAEWAQCMMKYLVAYCPADQKGKASACFERLTTFRNTMRVKILVEAATTVAPVTVSTAATESTTAAAAAAVTETTTAAAAAATEATTAAPAASSVAAA